MKFSIKPKAIKLKSSFSKWYEFFNSETVPFYKIKANNQIIIKRGLALIKFGHQKTTQAINIKLQVNE